MSAFDITGLTTFPTLQIVKLCEADKDQLNRIEAMLTELTSLPHNKRPRDPESERFAYWSGAFGNKVVKIAVPGRGPGSPQRIRVDLLGGDWHEVQGATIEEAWEALYDLATKVRTGHD